MENEKDKKLYRLSEVAKMLGIAHSTLREWARKGRINTLKTLGGQYRVEESELQHIRELMTRHLKKSDELGKEV